MTLESRRVLLESSGLVVVESECGASEGLGVWSAWQRVIGGNVVPTATVRADGPSVAAEVDARWRELAVQYSVVDDRGEFLVSVAGVGARELRWAKVRMTARAELARNLTDQPSSVHPHPEFVTADVLGRTVLGVTTEEYDVWLIMSHVKAVPPGPGGSRV
jgi:hypothetical protein